MSSICILPPVRSSFSASCSISIVIDFFHLGRTLVDLGVGGHRLSTCLKTLPGFKTHLQHRSD